MGKGQNDNGEVKAIAVVEPEMNLESFGQQKTNISALVKRQMVDGRDYGVIPGTKNKTLHQPGAEKLAKFFGLGPNYELIKEVEDFEKGFFYYKYRCTLTHLSTGIKVGDVERSCNSFETKYAWKWFNGQRSKRTSDEMAADINTYQSMAQKRAFVAAVRTATMATDIFSDDIESESTPGPTTQAQDPIRINLMKKFMATATPRGFDEERIHLIINKMYGVESRTELTNEQISKLTEKIVENFKVLDDPKQKPERIGPKTEESGPEEEEPVQVEPSEVEEATPEVAEKIFNEDNPEQEEMVAKSTAGTCKYCGTAGIKGFFCDDECSKAYWKENKKK